MKDRFQLAHMKVAETYAELSTAKRLQVGCVIVKENRIISIGYNGTPAGWDNNCEEVVNGELKTKPEVLHAETNAIAKLARCSENGENSSLFVTHAPCLDCAKLIYQSGVAEVYYRNDYRSKSGIEFLNKGGISVKKI